MSEACKSFQIAEMKCYCAKFSRCGSYVKDIASDSCTDKCTAMITEIRVVAYEAPQKSRYLRFSNFTGARLILHV